MGLISFGGIGSGLDTNSIVDALVEAERAPKVLSLDRREADIQLSLTGFGSLSSALDELRNVAFDLSLSSNFGQRSVSRESRDFFSASATSSATVGSYNIEVQNTATGSQLQSQVFTGGATTTLGAGTLTFTAGSETFDVEVLAGDNLNQIRDKINDAATNFGVSVNLLNNVTLGLDTGSVLSFNSSVTGTGNDLSVSFTGDAGLADISTGLSSIQPATNANIIIDGFSATSSTNEFADFIDGVTITAISANEASESTELNVELDKSAVTSAINSFIEAFNAFSEVQRQLTTADENAPGLLLGDYTTRQLDSRIRGLLASPVEGTSGTFNSLSAIGISTTRTGDLELDSTLLNEAIDNNFDSFEGLFSGDNGFATQLRDLVDQYTGFNGILQSREETLNNQLDRIADERINLSFRIEQLETRLRRQFAVADGIIAQFNNTASFLTQQLANLPGSGGSNSNEN